MTTDPTDRRGPAALLLILGCCAAGASAALLWRGGASAPAAAFEPPAGRPPRLSEPADAMPLKTAGAPLTAEPTFDAALVRTAGDSGPLDRLLSDELPHSSDGERDVWRDVLDGVPLRDAREIVRLRKSFGPPPRMAARPTALPLASPAEAPPAAPPKTAPPRPQTVFERAAAVHRHNALNHQTDGFLPLEPVLCEAADLGGLRMAGVRVAAGAADQEPSETGDARDVAAPAGLFLAVERDGRRLLRRCGRLTKIDGRPALLVGGRPLPAAAEGDALTVFSVADPTGLEPLGDCLYAPTDLSGPAEPSGDAALAGHIVGSAADFADEFERQLTYRQMPSAFEAHDALFAAESADE